MIRHSMYPLVSRHIGKVALTTAKPAATTLLLSGSLPFSTKPQRRDDDLYQKTFTDAFDESDFLEKGKQQNQQDGKITRMSAKTNAGRRGHASRHNSSRDVFSSPFFSSPFAGFDDLFARSDDLFFAHPFFRSRREPFFDRDLMPVLKQKKNGTSSPSPGVTILRSSPGYEIKEDDEFYEICISIPEDIGTSDMKVEVEQNGTVLHVSGGRKVEEEGNVSAMEFSKRFTIGHNVETDKIAANFSEGLLVVKAPKITTTPEEPKHTIVVTENPHE